MVEDRGSKALICIFIIGIGSVLPFNILMNAIPFFANKLNIDKDSNLEQKDTIIRFQSFIAQFMGVASTLPNVFLQFYNAFSSGSSGSILKRFFVAIFIQILCFACIIGVCFINAIELPYVFFITLLLFAFLINGAGGLFQNLSFALPANLPMKYTNAVVTGSNVGGIISALASIIAMLVTDNQLAASLVFFTVAIIFVIIQIFTTLSLFNNEYYLSMNRKPDTDDQSIQKVESYGSSLDENSTQSLTKDNQGNQGIGLISTTIKECWPQLLNIFLTFYVSLMLFPAVQIYVQSVNDIFTPPYFVSLFTFLNFNLFATIGNSVTFWKKFPLVKEDKVWIFVVLRFLLVPLLLFCNYQPPKVNQPSRTLPVLFYSDAVYILGGSTLGFTSGYFSSLGLMYAPKSVSKPEYAETAAKLGAVSLILGIFLGVCTSFALPYFV